MGSQLLGPLTATSPAPALGQTLGPGARAQRPAQALTEGHRHLNLETQNHPLRLSFSPCQERGGRPSLCLTDGSDNGGKILIKRTQRAVINHGRSLPAARCQQDGTE